MFLLFFVYGLAFFSAGIALVASPAKRTQMAHGRQMYFVAAFALLHAACEWSAMAATLDGAPIGWLQLAQFAFLQASILALVAFALAPTRGWPRVLAWAYVALVVSATNYLWAVSGQHATAVAACRIALGFPAVLGTAWQLWTALPAHRTPSLAMPRRWLVSTVVWLLLYAVLMGLVGPAAPFFPASIVNEANFLAVVGLPVQWFRAACAIGIAVTLVRALGALDREAVESLQRSRAAFEELSAQTSLRLERETVERGRIQALLLGQERLVTVGTLASGIAHELNNPLSYVAANVDFSRGLLSELALKSDDLADLTDALSQAAEGAGRMRRIVDDVKTFASGIETAPVQFDVNKTLASSLRLATSAIKPRAAIHQELADVPPVSGNEARLGQVVLNLLMNAAQAIPEGALGANAITLKSGVDVAGNVLIEVRDTGGGIPAQILPRIFDPFFTTKAVGVGTGLGLSICHGIVTAMGGTIRVASTIGKGTSFFVTLPSAVAS